MSSKRLGLFPHCQGLWSSRLELAFFRAYAIAVTHQLGAPARAVNPPDSGSRPFPVRRITRYRLTSTTVPSAWGRSKIDRDPADPAKRADRGSRRKDAWSMVHSDDRRILNAQLFCRTAVVRPRVRAVACEHVCVGDQPGSRTCLGDQPTVSTRRARRGSSHPSTRKQAAKKKVALAVHDLQFTSNARG